MKVTENHSLQGRSYRLRTYRKLVGSRLNCELVKVQETDLAVYWPHEPVAGVVRQAVMDQRGFLEGYIHRYPAFATTLVPWMDDPTAPPIIREMIQAAGAAGVGPMAAVAGAIAEQVGKQVLKTTDEVVVENGGDIFLHTRRKVIIGLFAGKSPLNMKLGLEIEPSDMPLGVCTSSGKVGHSLSFGRSDAVCVVAPSCALADAAATAIANHVSSVQEVEDAVAQGRLIQRVEGIVVIVDDKIGAWGHVRVVPL